MRKKFISTLSFRTAITLLVMLLTSATAWAFKTETPVSYTVTRTNNIITISGGGTTTSWTTSNGYFYPWKGGESHNLANGMTVETNANMATNPGFFSTLGSTTFTFTTDGTTAITGVKFKLSVNDVAAISTSSEPGTTFTVTLDDATSFTGFEVTYGNISGSCGSKATWSLAKQNGKYTALTIDGSGAISDYSYTTVNSLWRTDAPWDYDLTKVTIGNNITSIGNYAFIGCQQLASLTIGTGMTTIGTNAFDHCDALTEVTLPASVSTLGSGVFRNCVGLTRINIQKSDALVTLGDKGLNGCNALQYIVVPTPALALQYKDATNWKAYAGKLRAAFGGYLFTATNEGGTAAYAIANETDLRNLSAAVIADNTASGNTFRQTANITLSTDLHSIGYNLDRYFSGTYDGGGYTISGLNVIGNVGNQGFFGCVNYGTVKNVRLVNPIVNVYSGGTNGALIGLAYGATVENCVVINPIMKHYWDQGAIIGGNYGSTTLRNLYFYGGNCDNAIAFKESSVTVTNVGRARKVTLGSGISNVSHAATSIDNGFVYNNERYYREGLTLKLSTNLSVPTGYSVIYKANGKILDGNTYTVGDGDVTLIAELKSGIAYIDADGNTQTCSDYTLLTNSTDISNLSAGWYVVKGNVSYSSRFYCESGDIHLILCDNAKMTVKTTKYAALCLSSGNLTIYAQSTDDSMGQLETTSPTAAIAIAGNGDITICGGKITATGREGISVEYHSNITIHGGQLVTTGTGTGKSAGLQCLWGNITLGLRNATDYITANKYFSKGTICIADGQTLTDGTAIYSGTLTEAQINAIAGKTLRRCLALADNADNSSAISSNNGNIVNVVLDGRTLYKDGKWNTICLPFDVTLSGSPLEGATARTLAGASINGSTLNLTFGGVVTDKLVAGTPYIIKWASGQNIVAPVFTGVTVTTAKNDFDNGENGDKRVRFIGTYNSTTFADRDNSILIMGGGNTLYYPNAGAGIGAQRAYFKIGDDDAAFARPLTAFSISFGDEVTTGIISLSNESGSQQSNGWYTVDGRRLTQKPAQRGMYINGGKKVIVK